jgi:hypothetical protein
MILGRHCRSRDPAGAAEIAIRTVVGAMLERGLGARSSS